MNTPVTQITLIIATCNYSALEIFMAPLNATDAAQGEYVALVKI